MSSIPAVASAHAPLRLDQMVLPRIGPARTSPELLSNTAKTGSVHCTIWVSPTARLVSGGALEGVKFGKPLPKPRKFKPMEKFEESAGERCSKESVIGAT